MSKFNPEECCPEFNPEPWDGKTISWQGRKFVKDRVKSFLHIPLNFAGVMQRNMKPINDVEAFAEDCVVLSDENSLWGADVYIAVDKDVPGREMATITGDFLAKVFEGPYRNMRNWIEQMDTYLKEQGKATDKLLFYYTTCPKCAKKHGKNYVVILAKLMA